MKVDWAGLMFLGGFIATPSALASMRGCDAPVAPTTAIATAPKALVQCFLQQVRSGLAPERASEFLADSVLAHQVTAEHETLQQRSPANYAEHIREFKHTWGDFEFQITELIAEGDRVYARWKQTGCHRAAFDGHPPSGRKVIEIASAVYRVADGKIVEYWIQVDRQGIAAQLQTNAALASDRSETAEPYALAQPKGSNAQQIQEAVTHCR